MLIPGNRQKSLNSININWQQKTNIGRVPPNVVNICHPKDISAGCNTPGLGFSQHPRDSVELLWPWICRLPKHQIDPNLLRANRFPILVSMVKILEILFCHVSSSQQSIAKYHISKVDAEQPSVQSVVQTNLCQPTKHLKMMPGWYNQQDGPMDSNHTENGTNEAKTAAPPAAPPAVAPEDCTSYRTWSADCGFGNFDVPNWSVKFFKRRTMLVAPLTFHAP